MITLISACSKNRVIGIDNKLPWYLPEDLKRFKRLTTEKVVLMGRKTYESIGRPLPNRTNIVLTRDLNYKADGVLVYNNLEEVLPIFKDIVVIGGSEIYKQFMRKSDVIELTLIDKDFDGDSFLPEIDEEIYNVSNIESFNNGDFDYHFITYKRK